MPHANPTWEQSASELKRQIELEREELPFLILRSEDGEQRLVRGNTQRTSETSLMRQENPWYVGSRGS